MDILTYENDTDRDKESAICTENISDPLFGSFRYILHVFSLSFVVRFTCFACTGCKMCNCIVNVVESYRLFDFDIFSNLGDARF